MSVSLSKKKVEYALNVSGFSKYGLAKKIGKPLRTVQRWLNEDLKMNYENLHLICKAMDIDPSYLIDDKKNIVDLMYSPEFMREWSEIRDDEKRYDPEGNYVPRYKYDLARLSGAVTCASLFNDFVKKVVSNELIESISDLKDVPGIHRMISEDVFPKVMNLLEEKATEISAIAKTFPEDPAEENDSSVSHADA